MNCRFAPGSQNDERSWVRKGAEKMVDKVAGIGRKLGIYDLVEFTPKIKKCAASSRLTLRRHDLNSNSWRRNISNRRDPKVSLRGDLGAGRFAKIGIPESDMMGPFVGGIEIVCGALLIIGLLTRLAAILLLIDISVAIVSTKISILLGPRFLGFFSDKTSALRISEHDSRGAHRSSNVVRFAFSAHRGRGQDVLVGCAGRRDHHEFICCEIIPILLQKVCQLQNYSVFCDLVRSRLATRFSAPPATINS